MSLSMGTLVGCGNSSNNVTVPETEQVAVTETVEEVEATETEEITEATEATEEAAETVTESTETAEAEAPAVTADPDGRTYEAMDKTMYAKSQVNVRSKASQDGEKLGALKANEEVKVTGRCNETGWYRISYAGNTGYVSDKYLTDTKATAQASKNNSTSSNGKNNASNGKNNTAASGTTSNGNQASTANGTGTNSAPTTQTPAGNGGGNTSTPAQTQTPSQTPTQNPTPTPAPTPEQTPSQTPSQTPDNNGGGSTSTPSTPDNGGNTGGSTSSGDQFGGAPDYGITVPIEPYEPPAGSGDIIGNPDSGIESAPNWRPGGPSNWAN